MNSVNEHFNVLDENDVYKISLMNNLLKEWLIHQLGLEVNFPHPNNLCSKFQNGILIGKLLQNYNVVSLTDFSLLQNQEDEATKVSNFEHLKVWLSMINISLDDDTVNGIISGNRSATFGLLYRLCFFLECPNNLNLIGPIKQSQSFEKLDLIDIQHKREKTFIDFSYKDEQCNSNTIISSININKLPYFEKSDEILSVIYDEINQFESSLPEKLNNWVARGDTSCTRFLSDIKARREHSKIYNSWIKSTISAHLEMNLDFSTGHNRNNLRKKSMPDKLTWMSEYEKNMLHKVNNARFFINNRNTISIKNRVQLVNEYKTNERSYTINEETKLKMEAESIEICNRLKKDELRKTMKNIVKDLADFSVGCGVYRKKYRGDFPKYLWENWMNMFINGRPFLINTIYEKPGRLLDPIYVTDNKQYADEELKTQAILNRNDVLQYLKGTHNWSSQALGVKTYDHPIISRILGFLVYDVFTAVYKQPMSLVDIYNVTFGPVVGVLSCKMEASTKHDVSQALIKRNILPVLQETAVEHCLNAFYRETDNTELIQLLENFDTRSTANSFYDCKSDDIQESKLNNFNLTSSNENRQSKQTQTPEKIDKYYELERIKCGEKVFVHIYRNKPLPKHILIDCVLSYIKDKHMSGGCVLIEFSREEIMIIEERLAFKHLPPFGSYESMSEKNITILVPFKGPDLGDTGRYKTSITSYLKIVPFENLFDDNWNDMLKYYRSHDVLTCLQSTDKHLNLDNHKIEFLCDILSGKIVDWTEESDWAHCIQPMDQTYNKTINKPLESESSHPKSQEIVFKRKRTHGKSEFDFMVHIYSHKSESYANKLSAIKIEDNLTKSESIKSKMFNMQLSSNIGKILANFWISMENTFVQNMEKCFHCRRILFSEQEFFIVSMSNYLNEILNRSSIKKNDIIKSLQYKMSSIPYEVQVFPDDDGRLFLAAAKDFMIQLTNEKLEKYTQFIGNNYIERWVDKQLASMFLIYKSIIQTEVNRTVSTLLFINSYMSKLYNQNIPISLIPKYIDVTLIKEQGSRANIANTITNIEEYVKKLSAIVNNIANKVRSVFSMTSEWIESIKDAQKSDSLENRNVHLKIWKSLVDMECWRSTDQLKLIVIRFRADIKEIDDRFVLYRSDMNQRANDRLQYELVGIDRICNLFETAINERCIVRHEIIYFEDNFYLNPENILFPNNPPPQPFPLLESENKYVININNLETIATQLTEICPEKRISLVSLSSWLLNYAKYLPQVDFLKNAIQVLRHLFGFTVNHVDWSDFIIHCLELPYPSIDELLIFKHKFMAMEKEMKNNSNENHIEGTINKTDFDSILLWYQNTLPPNPSTCFRLLKTKDLLFTIFSIDGKLDYIMMLLAMCKDNSPIMGLIKAISLIIDYNIMSDQHGGSNNENEKHSRSVSMESLYETLVACLKNYMDPNKSDIEDLLSTIIKAHSGKNTFYEDLFSFNELLKHDGIKSLAEIGFRFNTKSLSNI